MNTTGETFTPSAVPPPPSRIGTVLAVTGAVMQAGPLIGILGTVVGMLSAFHELSSGSAGTGDPGHLSKAIGVTLITTAIGMATAVVGVVLMLLGLLVFRCRQRWLVNTLAAVGIFWLLIVPGLAIWARLNSHGVPPGMHF